MSKKPSNQPENPNTSNLSAPQPENSTENFHFKKARLRYIPIGLGMPGIVTTNLDISVSHDELKNIQFKPPGKRSSRDGSWTSKDIALIWNDAALVIRDLARDGRFTPDWHVLAYAAETLQALLNKGKKGKHCGTIRKGHSGYLESTIKTLQDLLNIDKPHIDTLKKLRELVLN